MRARRFALVASLLVGPVAVAQVQIDDRPRPLEDDAPLTREELNRRKADQLLRDARTQYGVAVIRQRHEKLLEATSTLERAAGLDPDSLEIPRALIPLYVTIGRDDAALVQCQKVIDRDPFDLDTAFQYARLLRADGRPTQAIPVLQKAAGGKDAGERPERLLFLLSDLFELLEKKGDHAGAAKAQDGIIRTITEKREQLLFGNGFTREDLQASLARAYESLGRACVKTKEYDRALTAFRGARETLLKCEDPESRHHAVRINWNVSELAAAQGRWADAMDALDAYLEHGPAEVEPYEKKIEVLRKLGRDKDVIPALRKHAASQEYHLGLQLILARELAKEARTRPEAEGMYTKLLATNARPEIYRGLFRLYLADDQMEKVLDQYDGAVKVARAPEDKSTASDREAAQERARAMLAALRAEPELVIALLPEALAELARNKTRAGDTWWLLANLAIKTRQFEPAERFFRQCLSRSSATNHEASVYLGLIQVLMHQRKYADVVTLCEGALTGPMAARNTHKHVFESSLASALTELGDHEKALTHIDEAIKNTNDTDKVRQRRIRAHILAAAGQYAEAIHECEATLKEFTGAVQVQITRYALSNVYSLKGDHAKSEEQLRLILEVDPDETLANNNLGYQMADRNVNLDEAERLIRRAIEIDRSARKDLEDEGENAAYLDSLGWVLFRKGKLDEARGWLEKAAALPEGADDPTVWDHLGDVLARLDQPAKAKDAWQKSLKLYDAGARKSPDGRRTEVARKLKMVE